MKNNCVNKLLKAYNKPLELKIDEWSKNNHYHSIGNYCTKKWMANITPFDLLKRDIYDAVCSIMTLCENDIFYSHFPDIINTPDYGDNWGRFANYFEINNRALAMTNEDKTCCSNLNLIKLLPAIPPSAKSFANCIILSQIFPNIFGDGYNKPKDTENSLYGIKLKAGYSKNVIDESVLDKISPEEQLKAFNDLAHFRGIKTGFRTLISADQLKICYSDHEEPFSWQNDNHVEIYIQEAVKLIDLGFEAMFIDSAKHIGNYDLDNYTGIGALPSYEQAQYIFYEIRTRSKNTHISIIGEKCTSDFERYQNMGLTAGTDYITGDDFFKVREISEKLKYMRNFAPAIEIENDNYEGGITYEQRLNRINTALFAYYQASDKLPACFQMNDLFPLRYDTNTHQIMMVNPSYALDGSTNSHLEELFAKDDGKYYNHRVGVLFAHALCH